MKKNITILLLLLLGFTTYSQTIFSDTIYPYGNYLVNFNECHATDSFYVVQSSMGIRKGFLKLDLNGNLIYEKHYGDTVMGKGSVDCNRIIWKPDKFINVTAIPDTTIKYSSYTSLIGFDYNFNVIWKKDYKFLHQQYKIKITIPHDFLETPDGGYLISGTVSIDSNNLFYNYPYLMKTNSIGDLQWFKIYRGFLSRRFDNIELTSDLGIIALSNKNAGTLVKMNALGAIQNSIDLGNDFSLAYLLTDMVLYDNDKVVITKAGHIDSTNKGALNLINFDYLNWQIELDTIYDYYDFYPPERVKILSLPNSEFLICGTSVNSNNGIQINQQKLFFFKVNAFGDSISLKHLVYDTLQTTIHFLADIELTPDGGLFGCGFVTWQKTLSGAWFFKTLPGSVSTGNVRFELTEIRMIFNVYPNPASDLITIKLESDIDLTNLNLHLFSSDQKEIETIKVNESHETNIDTSQFPSGIYFIILKQGNKIIGVKKVIVNH